MKRISIFILFALVLIGLCAAQSTTNDAQRLIGTWVGNLGGGETLTLVLNANGTGILDVENTFWGVSTSGILHISVWGEDTFFLSPDGRRMIFRSIVFQKR